MKIKMFFRWNIGFCFSSDCGIKNELRVSFPQFNGYNKQAKVSPKEYPISNKMAAYKKYT